LSRIAYIAVCLSLFLVTRSEAQITMDSLSYEISIYGDVILSWTPPQGVNVSQTNVYRGTSPVNLKLIAELYDHSVRRYTDHHSNVIPGNTYIYWIEAIDSQGNTGDIWTRVLVTPPPDGLHFTSSPPTTAFVGQDYWYSPLTVDSEKPEDVEYTFGGPHPDGMELSSIAGGIYTYIYWRPVQPGQFRITLVATHKKTRALAVQEFSVNVASQPGAVQGLVTSVDETPLANTVIKIFQIQNRMAYETETDVNGRFFIPNVQSGEIFAYAKPNSDHYLHQWYPLGRYMADVPKRTLRPGDTLDFRFTLLTSPNNPTWISGTVRDATTGLPVAGTAVSFVRKENFIHIGDTSLLGNPMFLENFRVDTTAVTDANGNFQARLLVEKDYYGFASKSGYAISMSPDWGSGPVTNALLARAFKVRDGLTDLDFTILQNNITTPNRIIGRVASAENNVDKQAVIVLIDPDLQRGAGGGHTYRRYTTTLTDNTGRYSFTDLGYSSTYSVLAIPLEKEMVPKYFSSTGGTTAAAGSDAIAALGTVQNINFTLETIATGGVGTIYGRVQVILPDNSIAPVPGTLLFAEDADSKTPVGYAISDSSGWYSITSLPSGYYIVRSENMLLGGKAGPVTPLDYTTYNIFTSSRLVNITYDQRLTETGEPPAAPDGVELYQNYPNPFNPATSIRFYLPVSSSATLRILNALGREISVPANGFFGAGMHTIEFDAEKMPSGLYYYTLQTSGRMLTRTMTVLK